MTNPNPPAGGMPKWLILLLVIFLVIILGCCGFWATCHFMCQAVGRGIQAAGQAATQQVAAEARARGIEANSAGVSLPDNFPADVPIYSGFKATMKVAPPGSNGGEVTFTGSASPDLVGAYYESELKKNGWAQSSATANDGGFQQTYTKGNQGLHIVVTGSGGNTSMMIGYSTTN